MKRMSARVTRRSQVTIPKRLRKSRGIEPGTVLEFNDDYGCLIAVKIDKADPVNAVLGCLGEKLDTDRVVGRLRGRA
jgi:AbrB family looped-hinge helix DNA binding protein